MGRSSSIDARRVPVFERAANRFCFSPESQKSQSRVKLCNLNDHGTASFSQKASAS